MSEIIPYVAGDVLGLSDQVKQTIARGGIVALPTETYYGLGVNPFDPQAVDRLLRIKGRTDGKPILVLIGHREQLSVLVREVSPVATLLMDRFWPGPLTILFAAAPSLPSNLTAGTGVIGVRLSSCRSLLTWPAGAGLGPLAGRFTWAPPEAAGPGVYTVTIRVTDSGLPSLSSTQQFRITVSEVNSPPLLLPISNQTALPGVTLALTLLAEDNDLPINRLRFNLLNGPARASVDANTGQLSWTLGALDAGRDHSFTVGVSDDGVPTLSDATAFNVSVLAAPELLLAVTSVSVESVALSWRAVPGSTYRVQYKTELADPLWTNLAGYLVAVGPTASKVDERVSAVSERFYRVMVVE